ncbi:S41 family peptidase [Bacteroides ihuae]|uniref:S41 family peptidase n=1 Tax=Bacteroides ihuae TaxID=1852362 RepID=UPI00098EEC68|nr:S41 family peptidase [Bacteroides ihuae]
MRHKLTILFLLIYFPLFAQQQKEDSTLFFDDISLNYTPVINHINGWYLTQNESFVDHITTYNRHKSLCLTSSLPSPTQLFAGYYIRMDDIDADSITFECKYKYDPDNKAGLYIGIQQIYVNLTNSFKKAVTSSKIANDQSISAGNWQDFSIKEAIQPNVNAIFVYALTSGSATKVWINDCKAYFENKPLGDYVNIKYKADDDREFDKASEIRLAPLTPVMIENLEILGKVWGFLKYYHPEVARGNYNWDYELFRVLPQIANAKDKKERNRLLNQWIDKHGDIKETKDYSISDSSMYSHIINLDWIYDKKMFGDELVSKFNQIRNAKRDHTHYYIQTYASLTDLNKSREPLYVDVSWEDQGFRILTLFKFWNAMEYNFPFVDITDRPWNLLLKEFIPRFVETRNKKDYERTLRELFACINDSHTYYTSSSDLLSGSWSDYSTLPVQLTYTFDHQVVVADSSVGELKEGDIILKVDNQDVDSIIEQKAHYAFASIPSNLIYSILYQLFVTKNSEITVTYIRSGKKVTTIIDATPYKGKQPLPPLFGDNYVEEYKLASKNIAYININTMQDDSIADFITKNRSAKGIIIDMRNHQGQHFRVNDALIRWLIPKEVVYLWSSVNDKSNPGNFICNDKIITGTDNSNHFIGKVAIFVNQATQSVGEVRSMIYQNAVNSKVIGTTTAGAVGPVSHFYLPTGVDFSYSANGMYYPDWESFQRKGVKIDIPIKETVEDIRDGKDVWMEEAIQYIESD